MSRGVRRLLYDQTRAFNLLDMSCRLAPYSVAHLSAHSTASVPEATAWDSPCLSVDRYSSHVPMITACLEALGIARPPTAYEPSARHAGARIDMCEQPFSVGVYSKLITVCTRGALRLSPLLRSSSISTRVFANPRSDARVGDDYVSID